MVLWLFVAFLALVPASATAQGIAKQVICHIPPGNPAQARTLTLPEPAIAAHLKHGDTLGPCAAVAGRPARQAEVEAEEDEAEEEEAEEAEEAEARGGARVAPTGKGTTAPAKPAAPTTKAPATKAPAKKAPAKKGR